jgi:hypothetical protein
MFACSCQKAGKDLDLSRNDSRKGGIISSFSPVLRPYVCHRPGEYPRRLPVEKLVVCFSSTGDGTHVVTGFI